MNNGIVKYVVSATLITLPMNIPSEKFTPASRGLRNLLSSITLLGGVITRSYQNLNALAAVLPGTLISILAARADVTYISLDRPTQITGHLETRPERKRDMEIRAIKDKVRARSLGHALRITGVAGP